MNRVAAYTAVLLCASSLACTTTGTPPPAPPPPPTQMTCDIPKDCQVPTGKILVSRLATLPAGQDCIVVSRSAVATVTWEGDNDVKTLMIPWTQKNSGYLCDATLAAPKCADKTCTFDLPLVTANLCLCYGVGVVDNSDGSSHWTDPRLIIRP